MDIPQLERSIADLSIGTPSDTDLIISIGRLMLEEKIITDFALKILHNDIWADILSLETHEQKVRAGLYMTIVVNMTLFYGGYLQCKESQTERENETYKRLQTIALSFVEVLPKILRSITDKYLETYHAAKVAAFVHGGKFDDYFPPHPEEQKILDQIAGAAEAKEVKDIP
jgi:hypothetical protein